MILINRGILSVDYFRGLLMNLGVNARDAMPGGGVMTIETAPVVLESGYIGAKGLQSMLPGAYSLLTVSDT